jgi:hypothetical protein
MTQQPDRQLDLSLSNAAGVKVIGAHQIRRLQRLG